MLFAELSWSAATYVLVGASLLGVACLALFGRVPWHYNVRNLVIRWPTTVMTALAFTLVIGLLTGMLAFVNGMYRLTENSGHAENVVIVSAGADDEVFSNLANIDTGDVENQSGIARDEHGRPLCSKETYLIVVQPVLRSDGSPGPRRFLQLRGIEDPPIAAQVHHVDLHPGGQWFSDAGARNVPAVAGTSGSQRPLIEAVLGEGVARELGRDRRPEALAQARNTNRLDVGDTFTVGDRDWLVVGVMRSAGLTFDSEIWAKRGLIGPLFGKENYTSLILQADNAAEAQRLVAFFGIVGDTPEAQAASTYTKAALQPAVETSYYKKLSATNRQFLVAVLFVAAVMAVGGIFGVMNTMFAAISQRTKDIGVMRLLGFSRRQILLSFLLESLVIALVGGLLGCALGCLADGWSATSMVGSHGGGGKSVVLRLTVDGPILACGLLLTLGMGFAGGLIPALMAMRLKPLESLR